MATNLGRLGYVPRLMGANTPQGMGYVPRLGQNDFMSQINWKENQWTYIAGMAAAAFILLALMAKKRKRRSRTVAVLPPSQPIPVTPPVTVAAK